MAITFTKSLSTTAFLNAFNNNVVEFAEIGSQKAIIATSIGEFEITPFGNDYYFNFKEVFKRIINKNLFSDKNHVYNSTPSNDGNLFVKETINYKTFDSSGVQIDSQDFIYKVLKSVEQIDEESHNQIFSESIFEDEVVFDMYEGFPFDFGVHFFNPFTGDIELKRGSEIINKSLVSEEGVVRVSLIDENGNLTNPQLPGTEVFQLNKQSEININVGGIKKAYVNYKKACQGVYLKWLNPQGAFSYYLFSDNAAVEESTKSLGVVNRDFENIEDSETMAAELGLNAEQTIKIAEPFADKRIFKKLLGLTKSPKVYLWTENGFIEVYVQSGVSYNLRRPNGLFEFSLTKAKRITQTI